MISTDVLDAYGFLGLTPSAAHAEVLAAFRRLAKELHPDRGGDPERFRALHHAYDLVRDRQPEASKSNGSDGATSTSPPVAGTSVRTRWIHHVPGVPAWLARSSDRIVVGVDGYGVAVIDEVTGERCWHLPLAQTPSAGPVVSGDAVWLVDDGRFQAYDLTNGTRRVDRRWRDPGGTLLAPARDGVVVRDGVGRLSRWSASGHRLWRQRQPGPKVLPAVVGDSVLRGGAGRLLLTDLDSGVDRWIRRLDLTLADSPSLAGDQLVFASRTGEVFALDVTDGERRWLTDVGKTTSSVLALGDRVFVACGGSGTTRVQALDLASGSPVWVAVTEWYPFRPAVSRGFVAVTVPGTGIAGLDVTTGQRRWGYQAASDPSCDPLGGEGAEGFVTGWEDSTVKALDVRLSGVSPVVPEE